MGTEKIPWEIQEALLRNTTLPKEPSEKQVKDRIQKKDYPTGDSKKL